MDNKKELKTKIRAKLKAEGIRFGDYDNAVKVLNNCVMGDRLVKYYKSYFGACFDGDKLIYIPKSVLSEFEGDYR